MWRSSCLTRRSRQQYRWGGVGGASLRDAPSPVSMVTKSEELMNGMEEEGQIPLPCSCFFVIPKSENGKKNLRNLEEKMFGKRRGESRMQEEE